MYLLNQDLSMHLAAEKGKHLRLRSHLSGNLNAVDRKGNTALYYAASNGHLRCVTMLIDAKANVNSFHRTTESALMAAARDGHLDVVNALIEAKADVNAIQPLAHQSALHYACTNKANFAIATALVEAGALTDMPEFSISPVTVAIASTSYDTVKMLIDAGADLTAPGKTMPPLQAAAIHDDLTAAQMLVDAKLDINLRDTEQGFAAIDYAVIAGCHRMTDFLIAHGADVCGQDKNGYPTIFNLAQCYQDKAVWSEQDLENFQHPKYAKAAAIDRDYPRVFKAIVDAKADIASRGPDFETPLMRAANHHNVDGVRALIAAKADVNDVMIDGYTALAMAASEGSLESVSALIAAGANVNHASRGVTAIIMAVQDNHPSVLKALIAAKADVNTTYNQRTMLDIATMQGRGLIVKILKDSGAVTYKQMMGNNKLLTAVLANDLDAVDVLVDSANDLERDSALIAAVNKGFFAIVECMLDAGADPCAVQSQSSVLSIACSLGRADIARILIEADADVGAKDGNGKTAMQIAAQHKHRDIVSMLMAKTNELKRANKC